jgi:diacylglycerol kinase family enzyme
MERKRGAGLLATPTRYVTTTLTELFLRARRRPAALSLERAGSPMVSGVHLVIVQNTSPWTFLGTIPVNPCPAASFDSGLDLFAIDRLDVATLSRVASRMLGRRHSGSARHGFSVWHDVDEVTVRSARPVRLQVDGEGLGEVSWARFESVPAAIRAVT